jgi:SP family general alpha glucoside:H+ symporter-like MFS transporter
LVLDPTIGILAKDWGTYCAARWFSGMAAGFLQTGVNNYISEVAPTKVRGAMILLYAIMFAVGGLLGTVMLNEVANYAPLNYKIAFYTEYGVLAIFLPGVILAPESPSKSPCHPLLTHIVSRWWLPVWAARRGNESKAKTSMRWLYGTESSYDVDTEYQKLLLVVEMERQEEAKAGGWRQYLECFKGTNLWA